MSDLNLSPAWRALEQHAQAFPHSIPQLFEADAARAGDFSAEAAGLFLDYSKQRVTRETLSLLFRLADQQDLRGGIERMYGGAHINGTENRAACHVALRAPREADMRIDGENVVPAVHAVLDHMEAFANEVREGRWRGFSGKPIRDVVNIGIGGSDLGPRMVRTALAPFAHGPRLHFISNADGTQLDILFRRLDPATTLWVVISKTFTTPETMTHAYAVRRWFLRSADEQAIASNFVAVSTNEEEVRKFGISPDNMFRFWDWVGGRYSLWSAVGLPVMFALGGARFRELLAGAHAMDQHFRNTPFERNLPVLMGLLAVWNHNFLHCASQNIAPYSQNLVQFVAWLQQLEMESNGKGVDRQGRPVSYATTPILWGDVGTNAQHAFFQMLHQGPAVHAVDFLLPIKPEHGLEAQQKLLIANCYAQSAALMSGKSAQQVRAELASKGMSGDALEAAIPHRVFPGNRPSSTLLLPRLDPYHLGALLALYEHRTYVQSVIWNINAFDQWGVELGKQLAQSVLRSMEGGDNTALDASTRQLIERLAPAQPTAM